MDSWSEIFLAWCTDTRQHPTKENAAKFHDLMEKTCNNEEFVLRSQRLGHNSATAIGRALMRNKAIRKLDLHENVIRDAGALAICQVLQQKRNLNIKQQLQLKGTNNHHENIFSDKDDEDEMEELWRRNKQQQQKSPANTSSSTNKTPSRTNSTNSNHDEFPHNVTSDSNHVDNTNLHGLFVLNLGSNDIGTTGAQAIVNQIVEETMLRVLILGSNEGDLYANKIDSDVGKSLAEALLKNKSIVALDLNRNPIGKDHQEAFKSFAKVLFKNTQLSALRLGATQMTTTSAAYLLGALRSNSSLSYMDLSNNGLSFELGECFYEVIGRPDCALSVLLLQKNKLKGRGTVNLAKALKVNTSITTLNLEENKIRDEGACAIADVLFSNRTITYINLSSNEIEEEGCCALADALYSNNTVATVLLNNNRIRDQGAVALARALESHESLTHLELNSARIGEEGAVALAVSLATNTSLVTLKLHDNYISEGAGTTLYEMLDRNTQLTSVNIRGNQVDHTTYLKIKKILKRNKTAKMLRDAGTLEKEVIRLQFQQHKLGEAHESLQDKKLERINTENDVTKIMMELMKAKTEASAKSKELQDSILVELKLMEEVAGRIKAHQAEFQKMRSEYEEQFRTLNEELRQETMAREQSEQELEEKTNELQNLAENQGEELKMIEHEIGLAQHQASVSLMEANEHRKQLSTISEKVAKLEELLGDTADNLIAASLSSDQPAHVAVPASVPSSVPSSRSASASPSPLPAPPTIHKPPIFNPVVKKNTSFTPRISPTKPPKRT